MKVLFLNAVCGTGSTGRLVMDLSEALQAQGHETLLVYGVGTAPAAENIWKMNHAPGYYWHNALSRLTDHTGCYSTPQTRRLIQKIQDFRPDVVHLHNLHGYYVNYPLLMDFLAKADIPTVLTLHDCWTFTGHCAYFDRADCGQWRSRCGRCPQLRAYPVCYTRGDPGGNFDRKQAAFTAPEKLCIAAPSAWLAGLAGQSFLRKYPIRVIPNGIDTALFRPTPSDFREKHDLLGKTVILGAASVWDERKGLADFPALSQLLGDQYQIVLAGLSQKQLRSLPPHILGLPKLEDPRELAKLYTAADIFANPTYEDNFPTVNLEAQACGTPVVTYAVGGSPETLVPGSGRAVAPGDIGGMARAIREGLSPPGTNVPGRDRCCQRYLALYRELARR